jgi:hypothetical protein
MAVTNESSDIEPINMGMLIKAIQWRDQSEQLKIL